jgi:hypothetical protein
LKTWAREVKRGIAEPSSIVVSLIRGSGVSQLSEVAIERSLFIGMNEKAKN